MKNEYARFERKHIIAIMILVFLLILAGGFCYLAIGYHVDQVSVEGNEHYTDEQIKAMVLKGGIRDNSLLLSIEYSNKPIKDIPFVESMEVEITDHHSIKINVYEKALAGCVEYLGRYMYFDREGIIVESSEETTVGIPQVTGLSFDEVLLHEKLPVEDAGIFAKILSITQLLEKYDVVADKIHFEKNGKVVLYYGGVRVNLGTAANLDEKIMQLPEILPNLTDKRGVLKMEDYDSDTETVTFELDQ